MGQALMGWLALAAYEIAAILASRVAYAAFREDKVVPTDPTDKVDTASAGFFALLIGHFWPLAAPIAVVMWKPRKTPAELKAENERMQQRIIELERELGIGSTR